MKSKLKFMLPTSAVVIVLSILFSFPMTVSAASGWQGNTIRWYPENGYPGLSPDMPYVDQYTLEYKDWIDNITFLQSDQYSYWINEGQNYNNQYYYKEKSDLPVLAVEVILDEPIVLQDGYRYNFRFGVGKAGTEWDTVKGLGILLGDFDTGNYVYKSAPPGDNDWYYDHIYVDILDVTGFEKIDTVYFLLDRESVWGYPRIACGYNIIYEYIHEDDYVSGQVGSYIEEQTNIITNGWDPNPTPPDSSGAVNDTTEKEEEIMNNAGDDINLFNQNLLNFNAYLSDFGAAFVFIQGMFGEFTRFSWLQMLIQISLVIGIIAFVVNLVPNIALSIRRNERESARERRGKGR